MMRVASIALGLLVVMIAFASGVRSGREIEHRELTAGLFMSWGHTLMCDFNGQEPCTVETRPVLCLQGSILENKP